MTASLPPRIRPGQTIGIVAPAGPIQPARHDQLKRGLDRLGAFDLRVAPSVMAPHPPDVPSYLAASDDVRAAELSEMLADPDVRAIVLARGGYGIGRILPRLDPAVLRADPKPIVAFSDGTVLLAWAHSAGVRGIHGPMAIQLGDVPPSDVEQLIALLTDPEARGTRPWNLAPCSGTGIHEGPLIPANLTMTALSIGTPWPVPLAGAVALFEDVGERPYALDRYLTQMTLTGALRDIEVVVIGDLVRCRDPDPPSGQVDPPDAAERTIRERLVAAGKPCAFGAPVGHGGRNEALPFGAACRIDLDRGSLEILEAAVC